MRVFLCFYIVLPEWCLCCGGELNFKHFYKFNDIKDKKITMQTIYQDDAFSIKTYHNIPEDDIKQQNIDFWIVIGDKTFWGSAFTMANIDYLMNKDAQTGESAFGAYFWSTNMIILKEMTVKCLVKAVQAILNDDTLKVSEIFYQIDDSV